MSELCGPRNGWAMKETNTQPVSCRDVLGRWSFLVSLTPCNTANVLTPSQKHFNTFSPSVGYFICHITNGLLNHTGKYTFMYFYMNA